MASAEKRGNGPTPWRARYLKPDGTVSGFDSLTSTALAASA